MNPFSDQGDWLERKREDALEDLARLKARLDDIKALPAEERNETLDRIIRSADALMTQVERVEMLQQTWVRGDSTYAVRHWKIRHDIVAQAGALRLAA